MPAFSFVNSKSFIYTPSIICYNYSVNIMIYSWWMKLLGVGKKRNVLIVVKE